MSSFKCLCGNLYTYVPDDEAEGMPPSFRAKYFTCAACGSREWLDPLDLGIEEWDEEEFAA